MGKEKVRSLKEYIKNCKETFYFVSYLKYINYFIRKECSKVNGGKRMRLSSRDMQLKTLLPPLSLNFPYSPIAVATQHPWLAFVVRLMLLCDA